MKIEYEMYSSLGDAIVKKMVGQVRRALPRRKEFITLIIDKMNGVAERGHPEVHDTVVREQICTALEKPFEKLGWKPPTVFEI